MSFPSLKDQWQVLAVVQGKMRMVAHIFVQYYGCLWEEANLVPKIIS